MTEVPMSRKSVTSTLLHEPGRFRIMSFLAATDVKEVSFNFLKENLAFTAGNLSIQLKRLENASYIRLVKEFRGNKPLTTVFLTKKGISALTEYLEGMSRILENLKKRSD